MFKIESTFGIETQVKHGLLGTKSGSKKQISQCMYILNKDHGIWSHHFMGNRWGNSGNTVRLYFLGAPKSLQMVTAAMKFKDAYSLEEKL